MLYAVLRCNNVKFLTGKIAIFEIALVMLNTGEFDVIRKVHGVVLTIWKFVPKDPEEVPPAATLPISRSLNLGFSVAR